MMVRWWWFGPSVTTTELDREMRQMKEAGIGGFEVQPVYPLSLDDPRHGIRNLPYLSPEFLKALEFTAQRARELSLRMDLTLGSGWPFGGPHIPITQAAARLRCDRIPVPAGATTLAIPKISEGEEFIAAFLLPGTRLNAAQGLLHIPAAVRNPRTALVFIASRTRMMVKRPAVGAEGYVLDHYDASAVDSHLNTVGEKLLKALVANPPYSIFSDSLEVFGSDWTSDLLEQFRIRRGYDLTPHLPALVTNVDDRTGAIRNDWALTLTELVDERYLARVNAWAHNHGARFRSQTYGMPPVTMSSSNLVDLPEGEGAHWRKFSTARWASSAAHLYGKPVTSSETWTWLHSPSFRATPLDFKVEADLHFLEGVNQLVGHGWPYSPPEAGEPGWRFYAAAAINAHNPWWGVMPDLAAYLQRVSYILRQGTPAKDIALYLPTADARATFTLGKASIDRSMDEVLGPNVIPAILDAGYNFDFIDDEAIAKSGIPHSILLLPNVERVPLSTAQKLEDFAGRGGIVVATKRKPSRAPGLMESERDTPRILQVIAKLPLHLVADEKDLGSALNKLLAPGIPNKPPELGFTQRKLEGADVYFIANTSNHAVNASVSLRTTHKQIEQWDPFTGARSGASNELKLAPYESRILVAQDSPVSPTASAAATLITDLSTGWTVTFDSTHETREFSRLHSWADDAATRFYSGTATYQRSITVPSISATRRVYLNFGEGTPVPPAELRNGMRAWLESPVREAALVYVNGQLAGPVWHPPYEVEVRSFIRTGENDFKVVVGNLAINRLAGEPPPDYTALRRKFGNRFDPQDMDNLQPLPSGLLGPVRLLFR